MFEVTIYTDGACKGNPGPGGYSAILCYKGAEKVISGYDTMTTNNKMELMAAVKALEALRKPSNVTFYTDSLYLIQCYKHTEEWRTAENRPNSNIWQMLSKAVKNGGHSINFVKVPGHAGNYYNERCDKIAREAAVKACHVLAGRVKE